MKGFVALVGAGPGDPGLLTVKAARFLAEADVLVYDALAAAPIVALASPHCERIYVGKRAHQHTMPQEEISALLVRHARAGKRVVRLKGGDPFVFGRGGEEAQELRAAGIAFEIVPGISSALAAPAYAGIPVTHREVNTNFTVATGHEDPSKHQSTLDWERLADGHGTTIFLMAMGNLAGIIDELRTHGRAADTPVAIISNGTTPRQKTIVATLSTIVDEVARTGIAAPAVVVVGEVVRYRQELRWFDQHPLFGKRILITRPDGDAEQLSSRLWELGAEPVHIPVIEIAAPSEPQFAQRYIQALIHSPVPITDWIVFTSRNAVRSFFHELESGRNDARILGRTRVAAVGTATAAVLKHYGIHADLVPATFHAQALGQALAQADPARGSRILLWIAENAGDRLAQELTELGFTVDSIAAYRTCSLQVPTLAAEAAACDLWTFASGSAVHSFIENIPDAVALSQKKLIICLGAATADTAKSYNLRVDLIPSSATAEAMLETLSAS